MLDPERAASAASCEHDLASSGRPREGDMAAPKLHHDSIAADADLYIGLSIFIRDVHREPRRTHRGRDTNAAALLPWVDPISIYIAYTRCRGCDARGRSQVRQFGLIWLPALRKCDFNKARRRASIAK